MNTDHAAVADLLALLQGGPAGSLARHLATCPACRERLLRLVELRRASVEAGDHPDPDDLLALCCGALSRYDESSLRAHVDSCVACRDQLVLLEIDQARAPAPDPWLESRLAAYFRERVRRPERPAANLVILDAVARIVATLKSEAPRAYHEPLIVRFDRSDVSCLAPDAMVREQPARTLRRQPPVRPPAVSEPVEIEAGPLILTVVVERRAHRYLVVRARDRSGQPAAGVTVEVIPARGKPSIARSNEHGQVRLRLLLGSSRLLVAGGTLLDLPIRVERGS